MAVLDQMVNPRWPYLPERQENYETEEEREAIEGIWNTIPDDPLNYCFYYHILDGDEGGRPPKILTSDGHQQMENKYFNWEDKSCLHAIAKSNNKVISLNLKKKTGKCLEIVAEVKSVMSLKIFRNSRDIQICMLMIHITADSKITLNPCFGQNQYFILIFRKLCSILWSEC